MTTVPLTLQVTPRVRAALGEAAAARGYGAGQFAQLLFEAGFAARIGQQRGQPADDAELDEAVRAVFCLAGEFDAAAIARVTGFPESLVLRVLEGLSTAGGRGAGNRPAPAPPAPSAEIPERAAPLRTAGMLDSAERATLRSLYAAGKNVRLIAAQLGVTEASLRFHIQHHRALFPPRRGGRA